MQNKYLALLRIADFQKKSYGRTKTQMVNNIYLI